MQSEAANERQRKSSLYRNYVKSYVSGNDITDESRTENMTREASLTYTSNASKHRDQSQNNS